MNRVQRTLIAVLALAVVGAGAFLLGRRSADVPQAAAPAAAASSSERKVLYWHDPMVPGQKFDKPGKSPFMDMQLEPKYADEAGASSAASGVSIDPSAMQNLGIRVVEAKMGSLAATLNVTGSVDFNQRDVAIVQALYESADTGRPVRIPPHREAKRPSGRQREVAGADALGGEVPRADAGALDDPLVAGLDETLERGIVEDALGQARHNRSRRDSNRHLREGRGGAEHERCAEMKQGERTGAQHVRAITLLDLHCSGRHHAHQEAGGRVSADHLRRPNHRVLLALDRADVQIAERVPAPLRLESIQAIRPVHAHIAVERADRVGPLPAPFHRPQVSRAQTDALSALAVAHDRSHSAMQLFALSHFVPSRCLLVF